MIEDTLGPAPQARCYLITSVCMVNDEQLLDSEACYAASSNVTRQSLRNIL